MKTKTAIILTILCLVCIGFGVWFFISNQASRPSNDQTTNPKTDTTLPKVELNIISSDLEQAIKQKSLELSAKASDNVRVVRVEYLLDGKTAARSIEPPFIVTINLANLTLGEHTLQAVAYDVAGNKGKSQIFTFIIKDGDLTPGDDQSQDIMEGSTSTGGSTGRLVGQTPQSNTGNNGDNSGDTDDPGTSDPDPDPGPDPDPERTAGGWYASLPERMQVCSNDVWQEGPSTAPAGATVVPAGNNNGVNFAQDNKTFWFEPGIHTLGTGQFSQITAGNNSTYIGAPGAIIDGQNLNLYAFTGFAENVRIAYLEIRNFGTGNSNNNEGVVNHDASDSWTMEYLNVHHNDGAGVFMGSENIVQNNCLKDNGQYGFSMYKPPIEGDSAIKDIVIDNNEIVGNNQDDWESQIDGCGCTGAGKFWDVEGATVTNNYVHGNLSTGLWADTNDIDFLFDSNWIEGNSGEGIWYEISYNATISRNVIKENAWESGVNNTGSPGAAVYISESGGDDRLQSTTSGSDDLQIKNNLFQDNFSGISIYENSNRFCNSNGNTSKGYCTPFVDPTIIPEPHDYDYPNPINANHPCRTQVAAEPFTTNCRWESKNVQVFNNEFHFDEATVPCTGTYCGVQALYANGSNNIPWAPSAYDITNIQNDVMFNNNNKFFDNHYFGNWRFAKGYGEKIFFSAWQSGPFNQDNGSTFEGNTTQPPVANALNADTATLEGSIGNWEDWYSATIARSNAQAHTGSYSLEATVTSGGGWATHLNNFPGFLATPGNKRITFWAKQGTGNVSSLTFRIRWYDSSDQPLQVDNVPLNALTTNWQEGSADITAPANSANVYVELVGNGNSGSTVYADDFVVADL